jgi:arylformamidase
MPLRDEATLPRAQLDADYTARDCTTHEDFVRIIGDYAAQSKPALSLPGTTLGLPYDAESAETLDLFNAGENRPVLLFIHGGYWRALSKGHSAFMAPMLAAHGVATAVPDYTLSPHASLTEITRQMRAALAYLWHNAERLGIDRKRIVIAGSSAGGHLAATLAMPGWQAGFDLPHTAVHACYPISGLFELAPIAASHVQDWLVLSTVEVETLSPLRHSKGTVKTLVAVAEHEVPGFHRQSTAYADALGAPLVTIPARNHFDVILDLMQPDTALSQGLLGLFKP